MKRLLLPTLILAILLLGAVKTADAHCEVPCGIYADQMRFEMMLEDQATIAKAMGKIAELSGQDGALEKNQLVRWVNTKEAHATKTMEVIAQYFMAQRIKPSKEGTYAQQLTAAHAVMLAAMKCKQTVDPKNAEYLKDKIAALYEAYEGKPFGGTK